MITQAFINDIVKDIVEGYAPDKIYLFGSYAKGKHTEDSDVDLLIVKNTPLRKIERSRAVRKVIKHYPVEGIDIIVYTPEELSLAQNQVVNIGKEAIKQGRLLYERV